MNIEKLPLQSADGAQVNLDLLYQIAPSCFTEVQNLDGKLRRVVNFDILRQLLGDAAADTGEEFYQFTWPGKAEARREAARPIKKTLRPVIEDSVDWDNTQNLYIEGDNLEVLKLLQKSYLGKIKMIYIDPPYNTGKNLIYKNDFSMDQKSYLSKSGLIDQYNNRLFMNTPSNGRFHSDWCSMIYARLLLCRNLLTKDGIVCLTIDDSEINTVTYIMNEVFGENNHLATIVIKNNPSGRSTTKGISISHEYALFYSVNEETSLGRLPRNEAQIARYKEKDEIGYYEWVNFRKHGGYKEDAPSMFYPIYVKKDCSDFRIPKLEWDDQIKEYKVLDDISNDEVLTLPIDELGRHRRWKWGLERALNSKSEMIARKDRNGEPTIYIKSRMNEDGMLPLSVWDNSLYSSTEYGANLLKKLLGAQYFDYPKSLFAEIDSLKIGNLDKESIILDFFSGSATTAHAVMQLNADDGGKRKFILVQLPELTEENSEAKKAGYDNICEIGKERIRRAGKKIKEEAGLHGQGLDSGFRVFRVDESNMEDVYFQPAALRQEDLGSLFNNVKPGRTDLDLLFGAMLDWGVQLSLPMLKEAVDGKDIYTVNDGDLVACFAENISENIISHIVGKSPLRVLFRDSCFNSDADKINIFEQFKQRLGWSDEEAMKNIRVI